MQLPLNQDVQTLWSWGREDGQDVVKVYFTESARAADGHLNRYQVEQLRDYLNEWLEHHEQLNLPDASLTEDDIPF